MTAPKPRPFSPTHNLRHKYGVGPKERRTRDTPYGTYVLGSVKEARYYDMLVLERKSGHVVTFLMQVPFRLPGGVRYIVDFVVFRDGGSIEFIDVKGLKTESYKAKKRMVEDLYAPIKITEV